MISIRSQICAGSLCPTPRQKLEPATGSWSGPAYRAPIPLTSVRERRAAGVTPRWHSNGAGTLEPGGLAVSTDAYLSTIDTLLASDFASEQSRSGAISSGPGYYLVELLTSEMFWDDDGSRAIEVEERYRAELARLESLLISRWGQPRHLDIASHAFEELPDPWSEFAMCTSDVLPWQAGQRWVALGVGQQDQELPFTLLAAVTDIDPP